MHMAVAPMRWRTNRQPDVLDRRIIAALHVDGRSTWRTVAGVLGQPERTVARRGNLLLSQGVVTVHGLAEPGRTSNSEPFNMHVRCAPGSAYSVATALASRPDSVVTHVLTGSSDCFVDIWCPEERLSSMVLHEVAAITGVVATEMSPVLQYIKTVQHWRPPGLLTSEEMEGLRELPELALWPEHAPPVQLSREDRLLLGSLAEDGRRTYEEIGRLCGCSEQTAARRVESMRRSGLLSIRALTDPRLLGLPVGALLRISVAPERVGVVRQALYESPHVRYGALVMGSHQFVADVRFADRKELTSFLFETPWLQGTTSSVESSLILHTLKQSGIRSPERS